MSLPPGFLEELRDRVPLSQVVGRKVTWDNRKSNPGRGDMWAPCPFHQEKTASFHVDDQKGFYYCFGCQAKGDAISFVKDSENVGFMEAVEILAREAGMTMPARDPAAQAKSDFRTRLVDVMEQAVQHYRLQLKTGAGAAARDYLAGRGLSAAALERWEIGFAPEGWQGLWDHLRAKGVDEDLILGAGLARPSSKGGKPYDVFRNRIMFPIRDARGRAVAFGARAMDPGESAKYLNSPETDLFDKGRSLFNIRDAREAAGKGHTLVVAEGYMDVIALSEAGFGAAVAPLGTAVTETQLQMLWRVSPEPVVALDGDKAGLGAAMRLMDLALPLLEAGQSLRFAMMPEGQDPDDLLRAEGAGAVRALLEQAVPMVQLLWRRETEGRVFDSPERRAALDKVLRDRIRTIRDPSIRSHYGQAVKDLRWQLFSSRPSRNGTAARRGFRGKEAADTAPLQGTKSSLLAASGDTVSDHMREAVILASAIVTPQVIPEFEHQIETMVCSDPLHERLRHLILDLDSDAPEQLAGRIADEVGPDTLENLFALRHVAISPCVRQPGDAETARMTLAGELAKLEARRGLFAEVAEAAEEMTQLADEAVTWRLGQAVEAHDRANNFGQEDKAEYDTGDNGAPINRDERSAFDALLEKISYSKPGR